MAREDKLKALDAAISQIEKQYGKGSIMKLVRNPVVRQRLPCMRLPRYRKGAESQDLLMRSMHLIRLMPRISV
mgnify:CR=1 FL=1